MKQALSFLWMVLCLPYSHAQQVTAADLPTAVIEEFELRYPDAKSIVWSLDDQNFRADFKNYKMTTVAVIEPDGIMLRTETEIKTMALPEPAIACLKDLCPGKDISEAIIIEDQEGIITFEAEVDKRDYAFDAEGKLQNRQAFATAAGNKP